ncbi:MAG: NHLP bacteriocin system secretion protein [Acidobacteria bacterium]|nr:NHLP bacteriocin system secretion protein [Acidobacteriota bacterium]
MTDSSEASKIFRKVALERMSSPEQLDQLLRVTTPKTWLALLSILIFLGMTVAWGYFGELTTRVSGQGVLIRSGGVRNVVPLGAGQVLDITVNVGDRVAVGQVIGTVAQPSLVEQIRIARSRLSETIAQRDEMLKVRSNRGRLQLEALRRERTNIEREIEGLVKEAQAIREQIPVDEELLAKGLITKSQVSDTRARLENTQATASARRARLAQLDAIEFETGTASIEANLALQNQVAELEREVGVLEAQLQSASRVVSPYAGQVLEIKVSPGGLVAVGTPIISLQPDVDTLEAVLYVAADRAKDLHAGMDAEILPTTVRREEYGFIRGTVTFVSDYPATEAASMRVFENAPLVQALGARGPVTEVRVRMSTDAATPSGYRWSSPLGAPVTLTGGTLCVGDVVTRRQRPINLVVPELKAALGVS